MRLRYKIEKEKKKKDLYISLWIVQSSVLHLPELKVQSYGAVADVWSSDWGAVDCSIREKA